jgi:hypothetical protein
VLRTDEGGKQDRIMDADHCVGVRCRERAMAGSGEAYSSKPNVCIQPTVLPP